MTPLNLEMEKKTKIAIMPNVIIKLQKAVGRILICFSDLFSLRERFHGLKKKKNPQKQ